VRGLNYNSPQDQRVLKEDGTRRKNVMTEFSNVARIARVRCLVIGAVGELVIFNEHMTGK